VIGGARWPEGRDGTEAARARWADWAATEAVAAAGALAVVAVADAGAAGAARAELMADARRQFAWGLVVGLYVGAIVVLLGVELMWLTS